MGGDHIMNDLQVDLVHTNIEQGIENLREESERQHKQEQSAINGIV